MFSVERFSIKELLLLLIAPTLSTISWSQATEAERASPVEHIVCAPIAYLPMDPVEVPVNQIFQYWVHADGYARSVKAPETLRPGSSIGVEFEFIIDFQGCPSNIRIVESSGLSMLDDALLNVLSESRFNPADTNLSRQPVLITGWRPELFTPGPEKPRLGALDAELEGSAFSLFGVTAYYKPDRHSDHCSVNLSSTSMDEYSVSFGMLVPCVSLTELVGMEFRSTDEAQRVFLSVQFDFEADEQNGGGSYRTRWRRSEPSGHTSLRFSGYEDGYLLGELAADVTANWRDGESVRGANREIVPFTAKFRAVVEAQAE